MLFELGITVLQLQLIPAILFLLLSYLSSSSITLPAQLRTGKNTRVNFTFKLALKCIINLQVRSCRYFPYILDNAAVRNYFLSNADNFIPQFCGATQEIHGKNKKLMVNNSGCSTENIKLECRNQYELLWKIFFMLMKLTILWPHRPVNLSVPFTLSAKHISNVFLHKCFVGRSSNKTFICSPEYKTELFRFSISQSTLQVTVIYCLLYQMKSARQKSPSFNQMITVTLWLRYNMQWQLLLLDCIPGYSTYTHGKRTIVIWTLPPSH